MTPLLSRGKMTQKKCTFHSSFKKVYEIYRRLSNELSYYGNYLYSKVRSLDPLLIVIAILVLVGITYLLSIESFFGDLVCLKDKYRRPGFKVC